MDNLGMAPPDSQPLSSVRVNKPLAAANRLLAALHAALAAAAIAHRAILLLAGGGAGRPLLHVAMLAADLTLLFIWSLSQAPMWRPVTRAAFPDRLLIRRRRRSSPLPGVDVLVVTADPEKEPTVEVMNTVVSAMALDYPAGSLSVYLSDDAGSPLTLLAARKAYAFARAWVPFCTKYRVQCPCPSRYFAGDDDRDGGDDDDRHGFAEDKLRIKNMYETLTEELEEAKKQQLDASGTKADHDAYVEIISDDEEATSMPSLVYVSREKRRTCPHHFKAGALNVLLRVSGLMSNSPYVLVLDCDMNCNSRSSALEAMCFHLDDHLPDKRSLGFVQFPQMFRNLSSKDIYANELRSIFSTRWKGLDGLRGPILSGTGFYARRDALYGATPSSASQGKLPSQSCGYEFCFMEAGELERRFGRSNDLVASVRSLNDPASSSRRRGQDEKDAARLVARCSYEPGTAWGHEVGFLYQSVVEDYFTGYRQLFLRGWTSVYCYPAPESRPPFLGSVPTNLNDVLVQNKRWMSGLLAVGLSPKHCPLLSVSLDAVSTLQSMSFAYYAFAALYAFPVLCYATLPQLCFFRGAAAVPLFPNTAASVAVFASSALQHLVEVSVAKRGRLVALGTWWNEQRFWALNAVTGQLFACASVLLELVGVGTVDFELTSKASDGELYGNGVFDFTGCSMLLLPATTLSVLNVAALVGGTWNVMGSGGGFSGDLFPQLLLLCYGAALSYPLLEGMFLRQDAARVPVRITAASVAMAAAMLAVFG
ncbi:hypothetical protein EJB05_52767, partial [Eragrostis curvula]